MKIIKAIDYKEMSKKAASIIAAQVVLKPNCVLGLATGSTPLGTYEKLVEWCNSGDLDFSNVVTFNLDEYLGLDPNHEQSYRYYMNKNLFNKINIKNENTHVPSGITSNIEEECANYDKMINDFGGIDLQLLGIGHDGHIGFNEPDEFFQKATHCVTLTEETINANSRFFESIDMVPKKAITMGMLSIMQAKKIVLIASGEDKKEILKKALFGPITPKVPASILQIHPDLTVITTNSL
ncbi:MAG: glucosamine-6-phosphate deaminase [Clostridiaceae bacterium]|jgi:glucosamine-6-phosphate deaminase|nr:glucosamine-6-phosphate deaminase [Clostridiaceae bacterium]